MQMGIPIWSMVESIIFGAEGPDWSSRPPKKCRYMRTHLMTLFELHLSGALSEKTVRARASGGLSLI